MSIVSMESDRGCDSGNMHPPLTLHRHPMCADIIELFQKCHTDHPFGKFFGECTDLKIRLDRCFRKEKEVKRKANFEEMSAAEVKISAAVGFLLLVQFRDNSNLSVSAAAVFPLLLDGKLLLDDKPYSLFGLSKIFSLLPTSVYQMTLPRHISISQLKLQMGGRGLSCPPPKNTESKRISADSKSQSCKSSSLVTNRGKQNDDAGKKRSLFDSKKKNGRQIENGEVDDKVGLPSSGCHCTHTAQKFTSEWVDEEYWNRDNRIDKEQEVDPRFYDRKRLTECGEDQKKGKHCTKGLKLHCSLHSTAAKRGEKISDSAFGYNKQRKRNLSPSKRPSSPVRNTTKHDNHTGKSRKVYDVPLDQIDASQVQKGLAEFNQKLSSASTDLEKAEAQIGVDVHSALNFALSG
ncbi:hypothetical protein IFM89_020202 [Coptis chinensis]|uniref:COX assembly mitochondrial protein 2 homolog n=1 Tax=Coptis chinensis TaxID=261450 RepID=A0A835LNE3_9MAGN|nr:hypothetical protein IFM89_020202 [Coptis chinensis]